jgi:RHS repeat-associated protein
VVLGSLLSGEVAVLGDAPQLVSAAPVGVRPATPGGKSREVPGLDAGTGRAAEPSVVPRAVVPAGFVKGRSVEAVERRDVYDTVYVNPDGSETLVIAAEPVHFKLGDRWEVIDSRLVEGADGSWSNRANAWSMVLPADSSGVFRFSTDDGALGWRASLVSKVAGVLEPDGLSVRYANAWPGADLVYRVSSAGVEEFIELRGVASRASYAFDVVEGAVERSADGVLRARSGGMSVDLGAPVTFDGRGREVTPVSRTVFGLRQGAEGQQLVLSVDEMWLKSLSSADFPVVIDPTITPLLVNAWAYAKPGQGVQNQAGVTAIGNPGSWWRPAMIWRSVVEFDYWSGSNNVIGKRVTNAALTLTTISGGSSSQGFKVYWADEWGFHNVQVPRTLPPPYPYGHSWSGQFGSGTLGAVGSTATVNLTALYDFWTSTSPQIAGALLLKADNEPTNGTYTYKKVSASMSITYSVAPSAPTLSAGVNPADGSRWWSMPSYMETSESTNPESGEQVLYRVELSETSDFSSGVLMSSNWESYYSFPPVGALFLGGSFDESMLDPGQTYYWRISVTDGWYVVPSATSRSFVWDPDPYVAPSHSMGPFSVNGASGALTLGVSTPSFETLGGTVGAGLTYSSSTAPDYGLWFSAVKDSNANGVADTGEPTVERHRHGMIDSVWGTSGPTGDTSDYFVAEWNGYVTPSASGWQLGLECDQKARVWVNDVLVLDKSAGCSAVSYAGAIDWATGTLSGTSSSKLRVQLVETTGSAKAVLWMRQAGYSVSKVPSSWMTTKVRVLPVGWQFSAGPAAMGFGRAEIDGESLVLFAPDGTATTWSRATGSASTQGWSPDDGDDGFASQALDGQITVNFAGVQYMFNADGTLRQATTAVDDQNRSSAALYTYDGSGRVTKVKDPVSGRQLRMIYQGQTGCTASPIPTGWLCAVQFALDDGDAAPETWTTLAYTSADTGAGLASVTNYPDAANPNALDRNETWQFGYAGGYGSSGGKLNSVRDPLAYDAIRSGVWSGDVAHTLWTIGYAGINGILGYYWSWPTTITAPAASPGAARRVMTIDNTISYDHVGFTETEVDVFGFSPPSGYAYRHQLDSFARATTSYGADGLANTVTYDSDDRVTATVDTLGRSSRTIFDAFGNPVEEWGPIPAANTACVTALTGRDPTTAFPAACSDVPVVETDYDFDTVTGAEYVGLDATYWANTNLGPTATELRPALNALGVGTNDGSLDIAWGLGAPTGLKNAVGTAITDNFSAEYTGVIVFPTTGTYTMEISSDDTGNLWIDDQHVVVNSTAGSTQSGLFTATAGVRYRIRVTMVENSGYAHLSLRWTPPGGAKVAVPGQHLHPDYGYPTRVRTYTTAGGVADEQTFSLPAPEYGQVTGSTAGGVTTSFTYEPASSGWGRTLTRTLPAGNIWNYTYYGDTATLASAVCGVSSGTVQSGLMRQRLGPDPDGGGAQKRRIEEFVYDRYGHQRGSRVGLEGTTTGELDSSVPWSCIATVDGRQRPLTQTIPASATSAARTVWFDYAKNGNPLVTEACDDNVTGSPVGSGDTCDGRNGVITSTVDLLGRSTAYTDVWAKTTTTSYDSAGRVSQRVSPAGTETFEYTSLGQLYRHLLGGVALATVAYNASGELTTVSYGNSTGIADLDGAGRRFADRSIKELTFNGPGGVITSNTITSRDRNGRVLAETIDGQEYRYGYDGQDRLIDTQYGATGFTTPTHTWQYCFDLASGSGGASSCTGSDVAGVGANGNRVSAFHNGTKIAGYTYDSADRLLSVSTMAPYAGNPIAYDDRGNTTQIAGETLGYDGADRHMSTTAGANTVSYQRDLTDRIVSRTAPDGTVRYTYGAGGDTASTVLDGSSNPTQSTISLPGGVILTKASAAETWSYPNIQGSVTAVADATGAKVGSSYFYDPFGGPLAGVPDNSAGAMDYGWLGQHQRPLEHTTGMRQQIEMGARGYDQTLGRFLEVDPIEGGVDNDYGYGNDPIGSTDLTGRAGWYKPSSIYLGAPRLRDDFFTGLQAGAVVCYEHVGTEYRDGTATFNLKQELSIVLGFTQERSAFKTGWGGSAFGIGYCRGWTERRDVWNWSKFRGVVLFRVGRWQVTRSAFEAACKRRLNQSSCGYLNGSIGFWMPAGHSGEGVVHFEI